MRNILLFLLVFSLTIGAGCKKKEQSTSAQPAPPAAPAATPEVAVKQSQAPAKVREKLQGASVVREDLAKKNYSQAVQGLFVLKGFAGTEEKWIEYRELSGEVGIALAAAAPTNPDAAKALAAYRLAVYGR